MIVMSRKTVSNLFGPVTVWKVLLQMLMTRKILITLTLVAQSMNLCIMEGVKVAAERVPI